MQKQPKSNLKAKIVFYLKVFSLCILNLFFLISTISFNKNDPTLFSVSDNVISNFFGTWGANFAGVWFLLFGQFSTYFCVFVSIFYLIKFIKHQKINFSKWKIFSTWAIMIFLSLKSQEGNIINIISANIFLKIKNIIPFVAKLDNKILHMCFYLFLLYLLVHIFEINIKKIIEKIILFIRYIFKLKPKEDNQRKKKKRKQVVVETLATKMDKNYITPHVSLFSKGAKQTEISAESLAESKNRLLLVLKDFGIKGDIVNISAGPVVILYEFKPVSGIKISRIVSLANDIARCMKAMSARISLIAGRDTVGIELPNPSRQTVYLPDILNTKKYKSNDFNLPIVLGKDIFGEPITVDLTKMPHILIAGTTGSGKSVGLNTMILSLLYKLDPKNCKMIMVDPKMLELSVYNDIPHLLSPVIIDSKKAIGALSWVVMEMERRYKQMSDMKVRSINNFNESVRSKKFQNMDDNLEPMPYIVVVIDELADLMIVAGKEIESMIQRLAQMARACGIHLIVATQRPSVDVITGTIKANFPSRISFRVSSKIDSRTILGEQGAEQLLGQGDMLYSSTGGKLIRLHGPFISDAEVNKVVSFVKKQGLPEYIDEIEQMMNKTKINNKGKAEMDFDAINQNDDIYNQAINVVLSTGKASTSFLQRSLQIGYNKAATLIEKMEAESIISAPNHVGKREILQNKK